MDGTQISLRYIFLAAGEKERTITGTDERDMNEAQSAGIKIFSFPPTLVLLPIVAGIIFGIFGVICIRKRKSKRVIFWLLGLAVFAEVFLAGGMAADRVRVSPTEIRIKTGLWFAPNCKGFAYRDVSYVKKTVVRHSNGREFEAWEIHYLNGQTGAIELTDLWVLNRELIEHLVEGYGVIVKN